MSTFFSVLNKKAWRGVLSPCLFIVLMGGFLIAVAAPATAADQAAVAAEQAVERAMALRLAEERLWRALMRYRSKGERHQSLVDDPEYFLSADGHRDPQSELAASIRAMLEPTGGGADDDHFICRFPARSEWLIKALELDQESLPRPDCRQLDEALAVINTHSAALVFPAAHNNGPASMFGHTLLRVGGADQNELLSHAINYAAFATDTNGFIYAFKGLFGMYNGYFNIMPYYEKLNEYNDLEHRDVWEYRLNLTPEEVRRMVLHAWEMQGIASDYYYFDENCSFMLLFLLEVARPELELAQEYWDRRLFFWVLPSDTIHTVRRAGLIEEIKFRPAMATRIEHRASLLPPEAAQWAHDLATGPESGENSYETVLDLEERRQGRELAAEYLRYLYSRRQISEDEFRRRFMSVLRARSADGRSESAALEVPRPSPPEEGHDPGRITVGGGGRDGNHFLELTWRPAYHDLLDHDEGFTPGAQINFFALSGRYYTEERKARLHRLDLVDIFSLAPRDLFFSPVSWKVRFGLERKELKDGSDPLYLGVNTGGGMAWEFFDETIFYTMLEADLNFHDRFRDKAALGAGPGLGILTSLTTNWKAHLHGRAMFYGLERHEHYRIALDQNYRLSRNSGIVLKGSWERSFGHSRGEATLAVSRYF